MTKNCRFSVQTTTLPVPTRQLDGLLNRDKTCPLLACCTSRRGLKWRTSSPPQHDPSTTCRVGVPILKDHPVIIHGFSIGADSELEPGIWEFSVMFALFFGNNSSLGERGMWRFTMSLIPFGCLVPPSYTGPLSATTCTHETTRSVIYSASAPD